MFTATSADGTDIAWYELGGSGPDLLLGHATGFCGQMWTPLVETLSAHFRCVAYDVRGHGNSSSPDPGFGDAGWNWRCFAHDVRAVIEAAHLDRPFGVGHSCGGATELLMEQDHPGTFRALYLFEPVVFAADPPTGPDPERELAIITRKRRRRFDSPLDALANFSSRGPFATLDRRALDAYIDFGFESSEDGSIELKCSPEDEAMVYVMASDHDGYSRLAEVDCEVTVAHGGLSKSFTLTDMQLVVDRLKNGRLVEFPELGHFGPLEAPETFTDAVIAAFCNPHPSNCPQPSN